MKDKEFRNLKKKLSNFDLNDTTWYNSLNAVFNSNNFYEQTYTASEFFELYNLFTKKGYKASFVLDALFKNLPHIAVHDKEFIHGVLILFPTHKEYLYNQMGYDMLTDKKIMKDFLVDANMSQATKTKIVATRAYAFATSLEKQLSKLESAFAMYDEFLKPKNATEYKLLSILELSAMSNYHSEKEYEQIHNSVKKITASFSVENIDTLNMQYVVKEINAKSIEVQSLVINDHFGDIRPSYIPLQFYKKVSQEIKEKYLEVQLNAIVQASKEKQKQVQEPTKGASLQLVKVIASKE